MPLHIRDTASQPVRIVKNREDVDADVDADVDDVHVHVHVEDAQVDEDR